MLYLATYADAERPLKYSTIHEAAKNGDLEDVKNHLRRGRAVNEPGPNGATPLHMAAVFNQVKVAEFLIKKGADINAKVGGGYTRSYTPLELAAQEGHIEMVKLLIRNGAKVSVDAIGMMLDKGHTEVALDMAKKADVIVKDHWTTLNDIALWPRSRKGSVEVAEILIKKADVNALTSALRTAVKAGNAEIADLLLKNGADIKKGDNLLHLVFETGGYTGRLRDISIVKVLLKYGVDVNTKDEHGYTPLHTVIQGWYSLYGNYVEGELEEFVKLLIENGADVNATDQEGYTPLHWVAMTDVFNLWGSARKIVPILIENGADVNAKNNDGQTPLGLALKFKNHGTAYELRKHGAKE